MMLSTLLASPAMSATIDVTANATDTLNGADGQCSLREAITNINNAATTYADCSPSGAYGTSDTINIPAGTYTTAIAGGSEDLNATEDYDINRSVTITGGTLTVTNSTISGNSAQAGVGYERFSGLRAPPGEWPNLRLYACMKALG